MCFKHLGTFDALHLAVADQFDLFGHRHEGAKYLSIALGMAAQCFKRVVVGSILQLL